MIVVTPQSHSEIVLPWGELSWPQGRLDQCSHTLRLSSCTLSQLKLTCLPPTGIYSLGRLAYFASIALLFKHKNDIVKYLIYQCHSEQLEQSKTLSLNNQVRAELVHIHGSAISRRQLGPNGLSSPRLIYAQTASVVLRLSLVIKCGGRRIWMGISRMWRVGGV